MVRGERPGWIALAGIGMALSAVTCVSFGSSEREHGAANRRGPFPPGIAEALIAGAGFGAWYVTLAQTSAAAGMLPLLVARAVSAGLLVTIAIAFGRISQLRLSRTALGLVLACGALDIAANGLYVIASHQGMLAIVAVLTSLYPATTIALAALELHERLGRLQWTGVVLALGGAAAIAAGS
jgi:drug/metabolite transporter (DMT)-like permease